MSVDVEFIIIIIIRILGRKKSFIKRCTRFDEIKRGKFNDRFVNLFHDSEIFGFEKSANFRNLVGNYFACLSSNYFFVKFRQAKIN